MSNIFTAPSQRTTKVAAMMGTSSGSVMERKTRHQPAPSMAAASKTSFG
jgi:hypothetical protein